MTFKNVIQLVRLATILILTINVPLAKKHSIYKMGCASMQNAIIKNIVIRMEFAKLVSFNKVYFL